MPTRPLAALFVSSLSLGPLILPAVSHAQTATGTILGSFQDTTDGVLVGAAVVVVTPAPGSSGSSSPTLSVTTRHPCCRPASTTSVRPSQVFGQPCARASACR